MKMLQWMSIHTIQDKIKNEYIREKFGVKYIMKNILQNLTLWSYDNKICRSPNKKNRLNGG